MKFESPETPAERVGLGMELRRVHGRPHLLLPERTLFGWLQIVSLDLRIPEAALGPRPRESIDAIAYQRARSEVVSADLGMSQGDLDQYVSGCGAGLAKLGVDELVLRCHGDYLGLSARVRESALVAELTTRVYLSSHEDKLRISCGHPRVYGHLDTPAPVLAHNLLTALMRIDETDGAAVLGLGDITLRPLRAALFHTLPRAGWRLPKQQTARLRRAEVSPTGITLRFSESEQEASTTSQAANALADSLEKFREADTLLQSGDLEGAMRGYRGELAARGPEQPFLVERILAIASSQRRYFMDGVELARQVLGRWPDFAPAHAALASIAVAQGEIESAANRYRELSLASGAIGDEESTVKAALAGARLLRQFAPDESTRLYEVVLEHRPGHAETSEALADRYRDEKRWPDLVRLIRDRLAATTDRHRQARDHARLAEVLVKEQDDPQAALAELRASCRLDDGIASIREQRAEVEFTLGKNEEALASLERASSLHRLRGEQPAQIRNLLRGGEGELAVRSFESAEAWFLAALELDYSSGRAMRGAAEAATGLEHYEDASRLWRELLDAGVQSPALQAHFACELGRAMLASDLAEDSIAPLSRAAATGGVRTRSEAWDLLAQIRSESGAHKEALRLWERAIEQLASTDPDPARVATHDSHEVRNRRAAEISLRRARFGIDQGHRQDVRGDLERAFDLCIPGDELRSDAARLLLRIPSIDEEGRDWLDEVLLTSKSSEERATLNIRMASLLAATGFPQEGLNAITIALGEEHLGDDTRSAALQRKADILRDLGEDGERASVLQARETLAGSLRARAQTSIESAAAWLKANRLEACRGAIRRALHVLGQEEGLADLRDQAMLCLGDCAWRERRWRDVDEAYHALYNDRNPNEDTRELGNEHRLRWGSALEQLGRVPQAIKVLEHVRDTELGSESHHAQACRHLADLYQRIDNLSAAAIAQEAYAASEANDLSLAACADAWYRAGVIHRRDEGRIDDAKRCLDTALRISSDHLPALDALEQLAREEGAHERLAVILGRKVAVMSSHPERQRGLLVRLARIQDRELGRTDVARETYRRVLTIAPRYRPALQFAATDAQKTGNHPFACEALELLAGPLEHDSELHLSEEELLAQQDEALFDLATLIIGTAGQVASESMADLLLTEARARDDFRLWTALAAAYRRQANLAGLAETLGHLTKHAEAAQALDLDLERIHLLVNELKDPGSALIALAAAEERSPEAPALARWHERLRESDASRTSPPRAASAPLDELLRTVETEAAQLLAAQEFQEALDLLTPYDRVQHGSRVLWLHVEAALGVGDSKKAIAILPHLTELARDCGDITAEHRATRRLADLVLETSGAEHVARRLYQRAWELDPGDRIAEQLSSALNDSADLTSEKHQGRRSLDQGERGIADTATNVRPKVSPSRDALHLQAQAQAAVASGNLSAALALLEEAIQIAPDIPSLYQESADIAVAAGQARRASKCLLALVAHIATQATGESPFDETLSDLHLQIASLYYDEIKVPQEARKHMHLAAANSNSDIRKTATLRQLASEAESAGAIREAALAYEAIGLHNLSPNEKHTMAALYGSIGKDRAAMAILESSRAAGELTQEGRSRLFSLQRKRSRRAKLATLLERRADKAPRHVAATRLYEALHIYEHILGSESDAQRLQQTLEDLGIEINSDHQKPRPAMATNLSEAAREAQSSQEHLVAASLFARSIELHCEQLSRVGDFLDQVAHNLLRELRQVVHPGRSTTVVFATRQATRTSEVHALIDGLESAASVRSEAKAKASLFREIALLWRSELHDPRQAETALSRALSLQPSDFGTIQDLADILSASGDYSQLIDAYELHLGAIEGPSRGRPLIELGKLYHHVLNEEDIAERYYREAESVAGGSGEVASEVRALRQTLTIVRSSGDLADRELMSILDRARHLESSGQRSEALALYQEAAKSAPQDSRAFRALRCIYKTEGEHDKLTRVLEQLTTLSTSCIERAELFFERAILARDVYRDDMRVYEYLKEATANNPEQPHYSQELRTISMARGDWPLVADLTTREIEFAEDALERGALHLELGLIFDEKLLDAKQALTNYEKALQLDPSIPAAPKPLARLYELTARHQDAAQMYRAAADVSSNPAEKRRLLHHAATNAESAGLPELAQIFHDQASAASTASTKSEPLNLLAADQTEAKPASENRPLLSIDEMLKFLETASMLPEERSLLLYELGVAYQHDSDDSPRARDAYEESLALNPGHGATTEALADLLFREEEWEAADRFYSEGRGHPGTLVESEVASRRAQISEHLGRSQQAYQEFLVARDLDPECVANLEGIVRLAAANDGLEQAHWAQESLVYLIAVEDVERLEDARSTLADLCIARGDLQGAIQSYESLRSEIPGCRTALRKLPKLYRRARLPREAIVAIREKIKITPDYEERAQLLFDLGSLYEETSDSSDPAMAVYFRAIDLAPEHVPTLRKLLAHYNEVGDFQACSEIAADLLRQDALLGTQTSIRLLYKTGVAAAFAEDKRLMRSIAQYLGAGEPTELARAVREMFERQDPPPVSAIAEAARQMCVASGEDLNLVSKALSAQESVRNLGHLVKSLSEIAD